MIQYWKVNGVIETQRTLVPTWTEKKLKESSIVSYVVYLRYRVTFPSFSEVRVDGLQPLLEEIRGLGVQEVEKVDDVCGFGKR